MNKHLERIDNFDNYKEYYRYEITVTMNHKHIHSADYGETLIPHIVNDVFKAGLRMSHHKGWYDDFAFNVVKEYQKNGWPHIHGTILTQHPVAPSKLKNTENLMYRKYGKTDIYATGKIDKWHTNDHFEGPWQEYLTKEGELYHYAFRETYINNVDPITFI